MQIYDPKWTQNGPRRCWQMLWLVEGSFVHWRWTVTGNGYRMLQLNKHLLGWNAVVAVVGTFLRKEGRNVVTSRLQLAKLLHGQAKGNCSSPHPGRWKPGYQTDTSAGIWLFHWHCSTEWPGGKGVRQGDVQSAAYQGESAQSEPDGKWVGHEGRERQEWSFEASVLSPRSSGTLTKTFHEKLGVSSMLLWPHFLK